MKLSEVAQGLVGKGDGMKMDMEECCSPDLKAKALAKIDEAMSMLDQEGVAYDQAANMVKEHLSVEEEEEPDEEPKGSGAAKLAAIVALKKKHGVGTEGDEELE